MFTLSLGSKVKEKISDKFWIPYRSAEVGTIYSLIDIPVADEDLAPLHSELGYEVSLYLRVEITTSSSPDILDLNLRTGSLYTVVDLPVQVLPLETTIYEIFSPPVHNRQPCTSPVYDTGFGKFSGRHKVVQRPPLPRYHSEDESLVRTLLDLETGKEHPMPDSDYLWPIWVAIDVLGPDPFYAPEKPKASTVDSSTWKL